LGKTEKFTQVDILILKEAGGVVLELNHDDENGKNRKNL
jgi:hypothetical protein